MGVLEAKQPAYLIQKGQSYADFCDRCGAPIGRVIKNYPACWLSTHGCNLKRRVGVGVIMLGKKHPLDLCENCAKELTDWMRDISR